jgi:hypothetical protein
VLSALLARRFQVNLHKKIRYTLFHKAFSLADVHRRPQITFCRPRCQSRRFLCHPARAAEVAEKTSSGTELTEAGRKLKDIEDSAAGKQVSGASTVSSGIKLDKVSNNCFCLPMDNRISTTRAAVSKRCCTIGHMQYPPICWSVNARRGVHVAALVTAFCMWDCYGFKRARKVTKRVV